MYKFTICFLLLALNSSAAVYHITPSGAGSASGMSWSDALPGTALQNTISNAQAGDTLWVACGTYKPTTTTNRSVSFELKNGVAVYGSFGGTETTLQQRVLTCGPCSILSGDIGILNNTSDNSYHVLFNTSNDSTAVIDGFVLRDGNANGTVYDEIGGGILNNGNFAGSCTPVIRNCLITANQASYGGGIFNNGSSSGNASPFISNCIISGNSAQDGGGIDNYGYGGNASPVLINCVITGNSASFLGGGGIYCWGGGNGNASPTIINCTIVSNTSNGYGGGIVTDNSNTNSGNSGSSNPVIRNTIIWNNQSAGDGPQFYRKGTALFEAVYSCIDTTGQVAPHFISGPATGMVYSNPALINIASLTGSDNCLLTADDGLSLLPASPLINSGDMLNAPAADIRGMLRSGSPDIGAYEADLTSSVLPLTNVPGFIIFPNPALYTCSIQYADNQTHWVQVYNSLGSLVHTAQLTGNGSINVSEWPAGIYRFVFDGRESRPFIRF